jgi:hypothetical protein
MFVSCEKNSEQNKMKVWQISNVWEQKEQIKQNM